MEFESSENLQTKDASQDGVPPPTANPDKELIEKLQKEIKELKEEGKDTDTETSETTKPNFAGIISFNELWQNYQEKMDQLKKKKTTENE